MSDPTQLSNEIGQAISQIMEYVKAGADLAAEQMPLVAQEIVNKEIALSCAGIGLGLFFLALTIGTFYYVYSLSQKEGEDKHESIGFGLLFSLLPMVPSLMTLGFNIADLIGVLAAPRLLVLEKLADLVK